MGKKRRMLHSKKFSAKHSAHPRMRTINGTTAITETEQTPIIEETPVIEPPKLKMTEPKSVVIDAMPAEPKTTTAKTTTLKKKATTRKTTTTKKAPAKKTTRKTTTKRTTKSKTAATNT